MASAHLDTFARDNLPPPELQPEFLFTLPELQFPAQLNCATELLDARVAAGSASPAETHWRSVLPRSAAPCAASTR